MTSFLSLFKKEIKTYFTTPLYFVVGALFLFLTGFFFLAIVSQTHQASLRLLFANMSVILLFITPIFTMRLIAEERNKGTDELLFTSPITPGQITAAKFFACLVFFAFLFFVTLEYAFILKAFGHPDLGPMITGYVGILLIASAYISLGLFSSSLTRSQMGAGMLGFGLLLLLWVIDWLGNITPEPWKQMFASLSVFSHMEPFQKGLLDFTDIFYFLSLSLMFGIFTTHILKSRR